MVLTPFGGIERYFKSFMQFKVARNRRQNRRRKKKKRKKMKRKKIFKQTKHNGQNFYKVAFEYSDL